MADLGRFLRRFRRLAAPPGRPAPGSIPADRVAERSAELEELLGRIDRIAEEADGVRAEAAEQSRARVERAEQEATRRVHDAREEAEQARAAAAARHREGAAEQDRSLLRQAEEEATDVRRRGAQRLDDLADRLVRRLLEDADDDRVGDRGAVG